MECGRDTAVRVINERQDIFNLLKDIARALVSDAPKTKKDFLKIIRKNRQVIYHNYKKEQLSKHLKLGKEGALILRRILAQESKHTEEKWTLTDLWDEIADLYVR